MKNNTFFIIVILLIIFFCIKQKEFNYQINIIDSSDDEDENIIQEPKRYYDSRYTTRRQMRVNVPTRGDPPTYQQGGILTDTSNPEIIKPLYWRQTYRGSNQWNYFTSLDSHLATKIPIYLSDKDCTDEYGCKEMYKDELITIGDPGTEYKVNVYQTIAPRYIPY